LKCNRLGSRSSRKMHVTVIGYNQKLNVLIKLPKIKFDENPFSGSQVVPGVQNDSSFNRCVTEI